LLSGGEEIWTVNTGILPHTVFGKNTVAPAQKCFSARLASAAQFFLPGMYVRLRIRRSHVRIMYGAPVKSSTYSFKAVGAFLFADSVPILSLIYVFGGAFLHYAQRSFKRKKSRADEGPAFIHIWL